MMLKNGQIYFKNRVVLLKWNFQTLVIRTHWYFNISKCVPVPLTKYLFMINHFNDFSKQGKIK